MKNLCISPLKACILAKLFCGADSYAPVVMRVEKTKCSCQPPPCSIMVVNKPSLSDQWHLLCNYLIHANSEVKQQTNKKKFPLSAVNANYAMTKQNSSEWFCGSRWHQPTTSATWVSGWHSVIQQTSLVHTENHRHHQRHRHHHLFFKRNSQTNIAIQIKVSKCLWTVLKLESVAR